MASGGEISCSNTIPLPVTGLASGAQLFVWSMRTWRRLACDPSLPRGLLATPYRHSGCLPALNLFCEMMCLLEQVGRRTTNITMPFSRAVSNDEIQLLAALRATAEKNWCAADTLLSDFFAGPLKATAIRLLKAYAAELAKADLALWKPPVIRPVEFPREHLASAP